LLAKLEPLLDATIRARVKEGDRVDPFPAFFISQNSKKTSATFAKSNWVTVALQIVTDKGASLDASAKVVTVCMAKRDIELGTPESDGQKEDDKPRAPILLTTLARSSSPC
jgi:hypothetical protein